jgi:hypothetical protein
MNADKSFVFNLRLSAFIGGHPSSACCHATRNWVRFVIQEHRRPGLRFGVGIDSAREGLCGSRHGALTVAWGGRDTRGVMREPIVSSGF